ncbi:MAG: CHC2 zinc finger domain-containing protein [Oscillospiraceae bacterium]|nr:CHC2 zinc finger domain-containing protein [Oscillospiraceae bacterium]
MLNVQGNIFDEIKARVTTARAAQLYTGREPNRSGFIRCPFHAGGKEKTPSLKLYADGGFRCFGCDAGGSCVDFTARLFGETPLDAVKRLNSDFQLNLNVGGKLTPEQAAEAGKRREMRHLLDSFNAWRDGFMLELCRAIRVGNEAEQKGFGLSDAEASALRCREFFEYELALLEHGSNAEQMEIFRQREDIQKWTCRALNNMEEKSKAG